jgi:hypothetical protein
VPTPAPAVQLSPWLAWAGDTAGHLDMAGHLDTTGRGAGVPAIVPPAGPTDSALTPSGARATSQPPRRRVRMRLSPLADSISRSLVLAPKTQTWFTAAARSKRLVVDIGRSDVTIGADAERVTAFQEAVRARTPLAPGARVRVRGPWGEDDATVASIGILNGRIIATLTGSARVDSVARRIEPLLATVSPAPDSLPSIRTTCDRSPIDSALTERVAAVRDSVAREIMAADWPPYERLEQSLQIAGSRLVGCFGVGRTLLIVSVRAGGFEWVRERIVVVSDSGAVRPLYTLVYRHRAHDAVAAFDADGDGVDDVAVRAMAGGAGALTILRLEDGKRLIPMSSGFAWGN